MPEQPKGPAPASAAKPACTIIRQKHSRWGEVRDSVNDLGAETENCGQAQFSVSSRLRVSGSGSYCPARA
ncbi:MAG TPA: hypothetical protein VFS20_08615 [Longimicrobium sp.]|nr:hypothetical protein [Longimicrobium sp.]